MRCIYPGLQPQSEIFYASPSDQAKNLFYYILAVGDYSCTEEYLVHRDRCDSIQLMAIAEGTLVLDTGGKTYRARAGDIVWLNCYRPHRYWAEGDLKMHWIHFDGGQTLAFSKVIEKALGPVFTMADVSPVTQTIGALLAAFRSDEALSEPSVSSLIHTLLCNLIAYSGQSSVLLAKSNAVGIAVAYMQSNYGSKLTIEEIAREVSVSPSYFSKLFRQETGSSPYEYLTNIRLNNAKLLLKETALSVAKIAERTGFSSQSNFIYTFHNKTGMSPAKFRRMGGHSE